MNCNNLHKTKMRRKCLKFVWSVVLYVLLVQSSAKVVGSHDKVFVENLPLQTRELETLAEDICSSIFLDQNYTNEECQERFKKPNKEVFMKEVNPKIKLVCQDQKSVKLAFAASSRTSQLVVMIPNDTENYFIEFKIADPNTNESVENIQLKDTTYKMYSTVIDNTGVRGDWTVGPVISPLQYDQFMPRDIPIEQEGFLYKGEDYEETVQATFSWHSLINECNFFVINYCLHEGNLIQREVNGGEYSYIEDGRKSITFDVPLADECTIKVRGPNRSGSLTYHVPKCVKRDDHKYICKTENVKNLTISVNEATKGEGWDVTVKWGKPTQHPKLYNITLRYHEHSINQILHGNAHQLVFRNVIGSGLFEVTLMAVYNRITTVANRKGFFPSPSWSTAEAVASGSAGAVLLALLGTVLAVLRRKLRDRRVRLYFPDLEETERIGKGSVEGGWMSGSSGMSVDEDAWELRPERLVLQQVLGEGAFGVVRRASLAPGGVLVAVKMLKEFPSVEEVRSFRAEMELMKSVGGHAHVVSLVGCCSGRQPAIVAEYCSRGDLLNYLRSAWNILVTKRKEKYYNNNEYSPDYRDEKPTATIFVNKLYDLQGACDSELTPIELLSFCRQVAMGMEFLASNRVVHRDLAARNILVSEDKTLKIADFGLSRDVYQDNLYKQRGNGKLPIKWMAIESLTHRLFTTQSDVWSFGVVMWEVVTVGGAPYPGVAAARLPRLLRAGYRMPPPTNCTQPLYEIMTSCWNSRPRDRPTFSELHARLDALLHSASADSYLSLQIDYEDRVMPKRNKYSAMLAKSKLTRWAVRKQYECPLKPATDNHYISSGHCQSTCVLSS